ncbi:MAG: PEGA domain-containing protein [Myxococcota bacterium]
MGLLLHVAVALAGVVTDVPPGETRVGLLVCPTEAPCADDAWRIAELRGERDRPLLMLDAVLELDGSEWEGGFTQAQRFADAMARARTAWAAKRWGEAEIALADAEGALRRWSGTAPTQDLFDLHYLKGAVALQRGDDPETDFRQAVAVAWNRTVTLPVEDPAAKPYYAVLDRVIADGTGTLSLAEPPDGGAWHLDGVELGRGPARVDVFPGVHRVTVKAEGKLATWKKDVQVFPGAAQEVSAKFSPADDATWVRARLREAFDEGKLPPEVMKVLSAWCGRKNVTELRILMMRDGALRVVVVDPVVRRVRIER